MSDENVNAPQPEASGGERPGAVTAFGILHIIFGAISILGAIIGLAGALVGGAIVGAAGVGGGGFVAVTVIFSVLGLIVAVILLVAGIMLLGKKPAALTLSLVYVIASIAVRVINIIVSAIVFGGGVAWTFTIIGIAYPLVVLFALVLNDTVKQYFQKA